MEAMYTWLKRWVFNPALNCRREIEVSRGEQARCSRQLELQHERSVDQTQFLFVAQTLPRTAEGQPECRRP